MVRVYNVMSPAFYQALVDHNRAHAATDWIYILHGVWAPEELDGDAAGNPVDAWAPHLVESMDDFINRTVKALHGDGDVRYLSTGTGHYTANASPWCIGWIMGIEWYPYTVNLTNGGSMRDMAPYRGVYVNATDAASPFESWITRAMDRLLLLDASYGWQRPVSFTNWLTTDPVSHIMEPPMPESAEDWMTVDGTSSRRSTRAGGE